ncbi:hypothetical protein [Pseudomonas japonica]|uniref:hypothetical protein n=1 Tax=Pseudomonas japonica TaxID=256466 RepID=UPI0015E333D6|nr:hypothetical protein [Pseudomonas japonica]MBA1288826.1 hypothetical protein [Pseudomonas japonica]
MNPRYKLCGVLLLLAAWIAVAYGVRYGLMENTAWVGACAADPAQIACQAKAGMGLMIHWNVLPLAGLVLALGGWLLRGARGQLVALMGLVFALPGLVLYTTSLAGVVVMLAALRCVHVGHEPVGPGVARE